MREDARTRVERGIVARLREVPDGRPTRDHLPAALRELLQAERVVVPSGELRSLERWYEDRLFGLGDLAPLLLALESRGHDLYRTPEEAWYAGEDRLYGQRQFLVQDPDGYLLRFCQDLGEKPLDARPAGGRIVS